MKNTRYTHSDMKATSKSLNGKRTIYVLLMALMVLVATNTALAQEGDHPLIGTWTFDYGTTIGAATGEGKAGYDAMPATDKARVKSFYEGRRFAFNDDGSYRMQQADGQIRDGQWALAPSGEQIILSDGEQRITYSISFSGGFLKMRLEGEQAAMALFRNWYLKSGR